MIDLFEFQSNHNGPTILFTGMVHGNEPCGEIALKRLIEKLSIHEITLKRGTLKIAPCCNPKAAKQNKRFIDINLNRIISKELVTQNSKAYEASLATQIMQWVDESDSIIDLHSFTEDMQPITVCIDGQNPQARFLAEHTTTARILCDSPYLTKPGTQTTIHYARHQHKPSILVECGQHNDPNSIDVAWQTILNILISYDMIDGDLKQPASKEFLVIHSALYHEDGQKLIFPLMKQDTINKGDTVFETEHGDIIHAQDSGHLFMRNENTPVGEEYAYICDRYDDWP